MALETDIVTLPAYWVSYLINGDDSGLEEGERERIDAYCVGLNVVDVARAVEGDDSGLEPGEPLPSWFTWSFDLYGGEARGGEVMDYVIYREAVA